MNFKRKIAVLGSQTKMGSLVKGEVQEIIAKLDPYEDCVISDNGFGASTYARYACEDNGIPILVVKVVPPVANISEISGTNFDTIWRRARYDNLERIADMATHLIVWMEEYDTHMGYLVKYCKKVGKRCLVKN